MFSVEAFIKLLVEALCIYFRAVLLVGLDLQCTDFVFIVKETRNVGRKFSRDCETCKCVPWSGPDEEAFIEHDI